MKRSIIYKYPLLYRLIMLALYGRGYFGRFRDLARLISRDSSVVDLCCGFGDLYFATLAGKGVKYVGFDLSPEFVTYGIKRGLDLRKAEIDQLEFPSADYYVMISSLYHFYPKPEIMVNKMLKAARHQVLVMEPVRNLTNSQSKLARFLARFLTNEGRGHNTRRFTEKSLQCFMEEHFKDKIAGVEAVAGGREKLYILENKII